MAKKNEPKKKYEHPVIRAALITGLATIIAAIIGGIFAVINTGSKSVIPQTEEINIDKKLADKKKEASKKPTKEDLKDISPVQKPPFSEAQIRVLISNSLLKDDIDKAINLLKDLTSATARDEETWHIFRWCIRNNKLDTADQVREYFRFPEQKEEANKILAQERIQRE